MSEERPGGRRGRKPRTPRVREAGPSLAAAEFKARCLELMDRVRETGAEYVITKHGRPVARLVPCKPSLKRRRLFASMKGTVLEFSRPFDPIDGRYDLNSD
jgi:prevent-host-death family protein